MKVQILFNNETINKEFSRGWGFSCLVDSRVLFDTGENPKYLFNNMGIMDIDISGIEAVVISHDHWDHRGGLWELLNKRKQLKVYACIHFSREFKEKVRKLEGELIEADRFIEVSKDIFITGEISGEYQRQHIAEQALVVRTENGLSVITGCAHPGIVKMLEEVKKKFPKEQIYSVFGGFHLMDKNRRAIEIVVERFKEMQVKKAGPTHCSGKEAEKIFEEKYGINFISVKAGETLDV